MKPFRCIISLAIHTFDKGGECKKNTNNTNSKVNGGYNEEIFKTIYVFITGIFANWV